MIWVSNFLDQMSPSQETSNASQIHCYESQPLSLFSPSRNPLAQVLTTKTGWTRWLSMWCVQRKGREADVNGQCKQEASARRFLGEKCLSYMNPKTPAFPSNISCSRRKILSCGIDVGIYRMAHLPDFFFTGIGRGLRTALHGMSVTLDRDF